MTSKCCGTNVGNFQETKNVKLSHILTHHPIKVVVSGNLNIPCKSVFTIDMSNIRSSHFAARGNLKISMDHDKKCTTQMQTQMQNVKIMPLISKWFGCLICSLAGRARREGDAKEHCYPQVTGFDINVEAHRSSGVERRKGVKLRDSSEL